MQYMALLLSVAQHSILRQMGKLKGSMMCGDVLAFKVVNRKNGMCIKI